jgi:hypothetical protein
VTTREEIIKLARETGLVPTLSSMPFLERFYRAAYVADMEDAAKVCWTVRNERTGQPQLR